MKKQSNKTIWPLLREGILACGLMALGIACAASGPLSIQAKALVVTAFIGCILFRVLEDQPTAQRARKEIDKE